MNRTLSNLFFALCLVGMFVAGGLVTALFWWLLDVLTGYTANLFTLAGY